MKGWEEAWNSRLARAEPQRWEGVRCMGGATKVGVLQESQGAVGDRAGGGRVCYEECFCSAVFRLMALTVSQALWKVLHTHAFVTSSQDPCEITTVTIMA